MENLTFCGWRRKVTVGPIVRDGCFGVYQVALMEVGVASS